MTEEAKKLFRMLLDIMLLSQDGGYGGIDTCITCKKNGRDKYKDEETGQEWDFCKICPNNMTNAYKE